MNFSARMASATETLGDDRLKQLLHGVVEQVFAERRAEPPLAPPITGAMAEPRRLARAIYAARRRRNAILPEGLPGEPAWDMLLELYGMGTGSGPGLCTKSVCHASDVPYSTAWRMLALLEDAGLVERFGDPGDRRRSLVKLSTRGEELMRQSISTMAQTLMEHQAM